MVVPPQPSTTVLTQNQSLWNNNDHFWNDNSLQQQLSEQINDVYSEVGIANDLRELELRLESVLEEPEEKIWSQQSEEISSNN